SAKRDDLKGLSGSPPSQQAGENQLHDPPALGVRDLMHLVEDNCAERFEYLGPRESEACELLVSEEPDMEVVATNQIVVVGDVAARTRNHEAEFAVRSQEIEALGTVVLDEVHQ